jgi:hypothetical protein
MWWKSRDGEAARCQNLEDYPYPREPPHQAEEHPAPASAHADESHRSVRPGYEQVDRAVVQHPQAFLARDPLSA